MAEEKSQVNFEIPESLHRAFKIYCVTKGYKLGDRLKQLIEREITNK